MKIYHFLQSSGNELNCKNHLICRNVFGYILASSFRQSLEWTDSRVRAPKRGAWSA